MVYDPHIDTAMGFIQVCLRCYPVLWVMSPTPKAGMQLRLPKTPTLAESRSQKQTLTVRNSHQKLQRQYLKPLLLLTFEGPTTWQIYSSVGENIANADKLLCSKVAEGPRECGCAEVRVSKGDADDAVSQDLPNCC